MRRMLGFVLFALFGSAALAAVQPVVCPAGGPIGSVDLRVALPANGKEPLPLRTINRLEEGNLILYHPLLHSSEVRKGEVAIVLVPVNRKAADKLAVLEPKAADRPQEWKVPFQVSVVAFVYGPSGLSAKRIKDFLSRDDDLVAQLADYAEKTAQTEALIAALSAPNGSAANVQSAFQGFSSQYGLGAPIDRTAPVNQQALALFKNLNPMVATYDPIAQQGSQPVGQTAGLAASVAAMFLGNPVGLAAGGAAMFLEVRSLAFPGAEFRSSYSQSLPDDGLGLCGRRDPAPRHTRIAYIWASRVPGAGPPQISVAKPNSLPAGWKSPLPTATPDADWKYVERARNWALQPEKGKPVPVKIAKLGDTKILELEVGPNVKPGWYNLVADWDWGRFEAKGHVEVRPLGDFASARVIPSSQDLLVAKAGKVPVAMENSDFEFVTKVEIEKVGDKFASPAPVPFVLPQGLRQGVQDRMEIQVNTIDLDAGEYKLLISQVDGKVHPVSVKILSAPPRIDNLPVVLNQGSSFAEFVLKGHRLDQLSRLSVARGTAELSAPSNTDAERKLTLHMASDIAAGTSFALEAYTADRVEPLIYSDAVRIAGPRPQITGMNIYQPPAQSVQLDDGELPGGAYLSAMLRINHLQSNSFVKLGCEDGTGFAITLRLGERSGPLSLQQLAADQLFLSFDTGA